LRHVRRELLFLSMKGPAMKQSQLNRAVARATGENLDTIQRRGFSFVRMNVPIRVLRLQRRPMPKKR
jgi:hypothetical protein